MTSSSAAPAPAAGSDELLKIANKIMKIGNEIKKDLDLSHLSPEEAEKATKMLKGFKFMIEKKNLELYKIWQKIEEEDEESQK